MTCVASLSRRALPGSMVPFMLAPPLQLIARPLRILLAFCLISGFFVPAASWAQSSLPDSVDTAPAVDRVTTAFQHGDPEALFATAADRVELSLLGSRSFYSASQGFYVMRNFLRQHPPKQFAVQRTAWADDSFFVMGHFQHTRADGPVRVIVRFDSDPPHWILHELRVEAERG